MTLLFRMILAGPLLLLCPITAGAAERSPLKASAILPLEDCAGFGIAIPGSSTCLRFSGDVRAETIVRPRTAPSKLTGRDLTHSRVEGRINLDARAPTEFGPIRAYASVRVPHSSAPDLVAR
ncbi:porin [Lichenihabitans psoromatis]|uniref:porin n=1 Tax=Lichenihabitans psoromatis TaxID=2528642 RepID=UPI001036BD2F|nr:porin [Lichenihabitans psoromatis]